MKRAWTISSNARPNSTSDRNAKRHSHRIFAGSCERAGRRARRGERKLKVFEDPRIDDVFDMLPNTNCGACGLPGCRMFAEKAVAGEIQPSQCTVGGAETAAEVADFLGVDAGTLDRKIARLHCAGRH